MLSRQEERGKCVRARRAPSCTAELSLVKHQALQDSDMHSPKGPYLKGKEKYLFPDLQWICSHWTRSRSAESSNPSTMSWSSRRHCPSSLSDRSPTHQAKLMWNDGS